MKFGVVVFPGSNCDRDMYDALSHDLGYEVRMLWHKDKDLSAFTPEDCIVLPGGFSYGDYLRCGAIARFSPVMQNLPSFVQRGGRVLGVCNGFQILCEAGLLPGALLQNQGQQFVCKNINIAGRDGQILTIPIAHGEGRYYADEALLDRLEASGQVIYKYCNPDGSQGGNPNGSLRDIAGICNTDRTVFGMMPHPERATQEALGNTDGIEVFKSLLKGQPVAAGGPEGRTIFGEGVLV
jgi:phosphoribosylformylglycinamidine synthase I